MTTTVFDVSINRWLALACLCLPVLVVSMDVSVLFFAVPAITADLHPSAGQQLWIFDVYGLVLAGLLLTMGALGDRIGRRRLLLLGAAGFSAASLLAAWAQSPTELIAARAAMGLGGATLMPSTLALVRTTFTDEAERTRAVGIWSAVLAGGVGVGPVLSGLLLEHVWWGSVFLINLPVMAVLLVAAPRLVTESRSSDPSPLDPASALLALAAVLAVVWAVTAGAEHGWSGPRVLGLVAGLALASAFVRRQGRLDRPMLDLALVRRPAVRRGLVVNVLAQLTLVGNAVIVTQHLQSVLGMSPLRAALWSLLPSVFVGAAAPGAAALATRRGRAQVMAGAFLVGAGGFLVLTRAGVHHGLLAALVGSTGIAIGLVSVLTLVADQVVGGAGLDDAATVAGLLETTSELAGALGIAVLGSVVTAAYRHRMPHGTLSSAVISGDHVAAARDAYVWAMHRADLVAVALLLAGAAVAWRGRCDDQVSA